MTGLRCGYPKLGLSCCGLSSVNVYRPLPAFDRQGFTIVFRQIPATFRTNALKRFRHEIVRKIPLVVYGGLTRITPRPDVIIDVTSGMKSDLVAGFFGLDDMFADERRVSFAVARTIEPHSHCQLLDRHSNLMARSEQIALRRQEAAKTSATFNSKPGGVIVIMPPE